MAECSVKVLSNSANSESEHKSTEGGEQSEEADTKTVMGPALLEDYMDCNVPESLQNLLSHFNEMDVSLDKNDITVIFIYILMLETGFVPSTFRSSGDLANTNDFHYKRILMLTESMPQDWKNTTNNSYRISFVLPFSPTHICNITCVLASDEIVVNCTLSDYCCTILLDPSLYVVSCGKSTRFQHLKELSLKFKNIISYPCKVLIMKADKMRSASLINLPPELLNHTMKYLDKQTNKLLNEILMDTMITD